MAMRILTLDRLSDLLKDKTGQDQTLVRMEDRIQFTDSRNHVSCEIPNESISNLEEKVPFLKFRDQVSGVLCLDGKLLADEEVKPYTYFLD